MNSNYLKQDFYDHVRNDETLFREIIISNKKYFFVWDYENQDHLWISNSVWKRLGYKEEEQENNLVFWQSRISLLSMLKSEFLKKVATDNPKLEVQFKNVKEEKFLANVAIFSIKNNQNKIIRIIGVLDDNWNSFALNYSIKQFEIILGLYKSSYANFDSIEKMHQEITKSASIGLSVSRASYWEFEDNNLVCKSLYNAKSDVFEIQLDLNKNDFPNYFNALQKGIAIVADDAQKNEVTNDLNDNYLKPFDVCSILDLPIRNKGNLVGILCCENTHKIRTWSENDISFGRAIGDIISLFTSENERREVEVNLKESQDRFSFISENITDGIFIVEDAKMVFASSAYLKMTGMDYYEKQVKQNDDPLHLVHPDDKQRIFNLLTNAIENKLPSVKYTFRSKKKNNEYIWREDIMNFQHGKNGKYRGIIITRDITPEKIVEIDRITRQKTIDLQNKLLVKLFANKSDLDIDSKINLITKIALEGLNIDRSNYWAIEGGTLICKNHTDITQDTSSVNLKLNVRDLPKYFEAMNSQTAIVADDVMTNQFTSELVENYLKPLGITDMLDIPVRENGIVHGVLCFEHRDDPRVWSENDITFARSLADFLSLSLEGERRKKAELKLIANQEKLTFISENTSDGVLIIENNKITYASPAYSNLSGYSEEFLKSLDLTEAFSYIHPEDLNRMKKIIYTNIDKKNQRFSYEYRIKGTNNKYYWREDSANVIYKDGVPYSQFILISRDITQRKKTEKKLVDSEQQLRLITENSTDGFVILENKKVTYISPSYAKFLGYKPNEILNLESDAIINNIHPEDRDRIYKFVYYNLENKITTFKSEFRLKDKSGKYHWREDSTNVIYDENGKYSKYIIISRDIDERKETEKKLVESEQQLRLISENSTDGIYIIEKSIITYMSPACLELIKHTRNNFDMLTIEDMFNTLHEDDRPKIKSFIYDNLAKKIAAFKYELRTIDSYGVYNWREDSVNVIYNNDGTYSKYIVVTRDISARKETELEKNRLYKITEKQNQKLVNFTHIVSHDIRSHTSNLSMILDLFEETKDAEDQEKYFRMMKESTNKLTDTIYYLNETVAVQSGKNNDFKLLNLKAEIDKAIQGVHAFVKTNEARLKISIDRDIKVNVTKSYLESIMFNLLTNAIKYKSNKRKPEINITAKRINNEVQLTIQDNGIGIDLNRNKDKIFGMYKTFHGNEDAVGLGLFMVKNHIESMGGRIEIESELDRGTTFNLFFV